MVGVETYSRAATMSATRSSEWWKAGSTSPGKHPRARWPAALVPTRRAGRRQRPMGGAEGRGNRVVRAQGVFSNGDGNLTASSPVVAAVVHAVGIPRLPTAATFDGIATADTVTGPSVGRTEEGGHGLGGT